MDKNKFYPFYIIQLLPVFKCCLGRIRTLTGGTRIRRATITPQGKIVSAKLNKILDVFATFAK